MHRGCNQRSGRPETTAISAKVRTMPRARDLTRIGVVAVFALASACSGAKKGADEPESGLGKSDAISSSKADEDADEQLEKLPVPPITKTSFQEHPAKVVWVFDGDPSAPKKMSIGQAEARGYAIADLGNDWVPYIFTEKSPGQDNSKKNGYRKTYIGLANDRIDAYGDELEPHEHNFLELYGIPPTLRVVWQEWQSLSTEFEPCLEEAGYDPSVFERYQGVIAYSTKGQNKRNRSARSYKAKLFKQMKGARLDPNVPEDLEKAATHPKTKVMYKRWREFQDEVDVIDHAQRRFRCERLFNSADGRGSFEPGVYDSATTHALANFEKKHDIMGWGHFKKDNLEMLALRPRQAVHQRLLRVLEERVVLSAKIVEDGSAARWKKKFTWKDAAGNQHELRNLVQEYTDAAVEALNVGTLESAEKQLALLSDLGEGDFENLLVAYRAPPKPEYYAENMKFSAEIDRGDIWYDFPYDELGRKKSQPRRRYPHLTLFVHHLDQKIPLVHWRTTIGSWRNEIKDGEVMLKYKNSDVGPRVWKDIVAAPVWIPPASTPPSELIKGRYRRGKFVKDVSYDEIGPGYRSAYGLVAGYHIRQNKDNDGNVVSEFDNSIRTHGSVDYMSILRRFSHGCHRLYNMDAVRMFSFLIVHREYKREGQQTVGVRRNIELEERTYNMRIDTRGYKYELVEPIPITVTTGNIKGRRKTPHTEYLPRPVPPSADENDIEIEDGETPAPSFAVPSWGG
jgi:hypothetical protein